MPKQLVRVVDGFKRGDQRCQVGADADVFLLCVSMSLALERRRVTDAIVHGTCRGQVTCATSIVIVGGAVWCTVGAGRGLVLAGLAGCVDRVGARRVCIRVPCTGQPE